MRKSDGSIRSSNKSDGPTPFCCLPGDLKGFLKAGFEVSGHSFWILSSAHGEPEISGEAIHEGTVNEFAVVLSNKSDDCWAANSSSISMIRWTQEQRKPVITLATPSFFLMGHLFSWWRAGFPFLRIHPYLQKSAEPLMVNVWWKYVCEERCKDLVRMCNDLIKRKKKKKKKAVTRAFHCNHACGKSRTSKLKSSWFNNTAFAYKNERFGIQKNIKVIAVDCAWLVCLTVCDLYNWLRVICMLSLCDLYETILGTKEYDLYACFADDLHSWRWAICMPECTRFVCLNVHNFYAWMYAICMPGCTRFVCLNVCDFYAWMYLICMPECTRFVCLNVPDLFAWIYAICMPGCTWFVCLNVPDLYARMYPICMPECTWFVCRFVWALVCKFCYSFVWKYI